MKKYFLITFILASVFIFSPFHNVEAQTNQVAETKTTAISGDEVCGSSAKTACTFNDAKKIINSTVTLIIQLGSAVLVLFIVYRFINAWFALRAGNSDAYKQATKDTGNAVIGFIIIVAVIGGAYVGILSFLGVDTKFFKLFSDVFIQHAYAAEGLTNPLTKTNSLYDFIILFVKMVMSFFIYPALLVMWVWSGFQYVYSQGNPEGIKKAHQWLMWAVISTLIVFVTQAFLSALQGTLNKVLPNAKKTSIVTDIKTLS